MRYTHSRIGVGVVATLAGAALALTPLAAGAADNDTNATQEAAAQGDTLAPLLGKSSDDKYIVVLKQDTSTRTLRAAKADVRAEGATVTQTYTNVLDGFAATLTPEALSTLRTNPAVDYIEPDGVVKASGTQSPATWGLDRIDQRNLPLNNSYGYNQTGAGVTAYIIDTGIKTGHSEFAGRASAGYTAINDGKGAEDCAGHGTHVAGTVGGKTYGVAKSVKLVAVRVLGCDGSGSNSGVIAGVDWVTQNHTGRNPAVANMSLGGGASSALDTAVKNSIADGVTYALAAGNDSGANACNGSPNGVREGLTVGSTTRTDARSSFSNIGNCVDLFAPGSDITSAWYTSNSATNTISGTSMATPHVAGAVALYLQTNPSASPATVANAVVGNATSGKVSNPGSGSPNKLLYTGGGSGTPNPTPTPDPTQNPQPGSCDSLPTVENGSLSSGGTNVHPKGDYYEAPAGTQQACLSGPASADFDLYLSQWDGSKWVVVARSVNRGSQETISYKNTAGYFSYSVKAYSGSGSYTIGMGRS